MALSNKQIKQLRALANSSNPSLWIGKEGVTDPAIAQADETLEDHELVKCVVQDGSPVDAQEAGSALSERLSAELVQVIGRRFVLYRPTHKEGVERIRLVRA